MVERFVDGTATNKLIYKITVKTANVSGAGTDGDVTLDIIGSMGQTLPRELDNFKNNFEAGDTDKFEIKALNVGKIEKIVLSVADKGIKSDWTCESVTIRFGDPEEVYIFAVNSVIRGGNRYEVCNPEQIKFGNNGIDGKVCTSDFHNAGTDATVTIKITDKSGKTHGPFDLVDKDKHAFERNTVNMIKLLTLDRVTNIHKISICHNGKGAGPDWHLGYIELSLPGRETYKFEFDKWVKADRWYDAVPKGAAPPKKYTVSVETRKGGLTSTYGTDNDVFINIVGKLGDSNMFQLTQKGKNLFEKGKTDVFERTMADLGDLLGVQVEKRGKINDQWHMQSIVISDGTRDYRSQNGPYEVNKDMVKVKLESCTSAQSQ